MSRYDPFTDKFVDNPTTASNPTQQTIYGYPIEYLEMIAKAAMEQGISPEVAISVTADVKTMARLISEAIEQAMTKTTMDIMWGDKK